MNSNKARVFVPKQTPLICCLIFRLQMAALKQSTILEFMGSPESKKKALQKPYACGLLVSGSRDWEDQEAFEKAMEPWKELRCGVVIHGGCRKHDRAPFRGVDGMADRWGAKLPPPCVVRAFPVKDEEWKRAGRAAGPIRNELMVAWAILNCETVAAVAFKAPDSKGTVNFIEVARAAGLKPYVFELEPTK